MTKIQKHGFLNHPKTVFVRVKMRKSCDENIKNTLKLANKMICLAEEGNVDIEDNGCGILYGVLLDSAYKVRKFAEVEKETHIKKGWLK